MTALTPLPPPEDEQSLAQEVVGGLHLTIPAAGFFAAIDGPSGVGKTTVTALTAARLTEVNAPVLATRQPSDSPLGRLARSGTHELRGLPLTYLMAADRHHHYEQVILPALDAGKVVLCDRYVATALVLDQIDGVDPEFVWGFYRSLGWPQLAIVLAGSPGVCHARAQRRGVYSRFHEGALAAAEAEAALYASAVDMLARLPPARKEHAIMKVALLYPEVYDMARFRDKRKEFPPFGVLYLAAVVEDAGHEAAVEAITPGRTRLDLSGYDAVGFSLASSATYGLMRQARHDSLIASTALVMVGGVHCNFYPESSLADFDAAVAAYGESEDTILEILDRDGRRDFAGIPGILWRDADGGIRRNPARPLMRDIDLLPLPARHLLPAESVIMSDRLAGTDLTMAHVMFSRGCPFPCSFCAAGQTRIQYRSGQSARIELEWLIDAYGIQGFSIVDDNFIVNKAKVADICDQVSGLDLRWSALSRVDTVDAPLLAKLAASGCIEIKYGMESGSEPLLKAMRKNTTRDKIRSAVHMTADAGIAAKVFVIHGFPGEDDQTTDETAMGNEVQAVRLAIKVAWERGMIAYINNSCTWDREARTFALTTSAYPGLDLTLPREHAVTTHHRLLPPLRTCNDPRRDLVVRPVGL